MFGKYGKEEGDFDGPHSVAVDKHDNIYVADLYNQRIQVIFSVIHALFARYFAAMGSSSFKPHAQFLVNSAEWTRGLHIGSHS